MTGEQVSGGGPDRAGWFVAGRWYAATVVSAVAPRDGLGFELEDVAPAPGRGLVLEAFRDDGTGELTVAAPTPDRLPLELVERFLGEARRHLR